MANRVPTNEPRTSLARRTSEKRTIASKRDRDREKERKRGKRERENDAAVLLVARGTLVFLV